MDPVTLATYAVSLLIPRLAKAGKDIAEKVGKEMWNKVSIKTEKLYETIKNKFDGNDYAIQTLKRLEEKPEDKLRQSAMENVLNEVVAEDPQFQKMLGQLLSEAKQAGGDNIIKAYETGIVATGRSKVYIKGKYAAGRDINIGEASSEDEE